MPGDEQRLDILSAGDLGMRRLKAVAHARNWEKPPSTQINKEADYHWPDREIDVNPINPWQPANNPRFVATALPQEHNGYAPPDHHRHDHHRPTRGAARTGQGTRPQDPHRPLPPLAQAERVHGTPDRVRHRGARLRRARAEKPVKLRAGGTSSRPQAA